MESLAKGMLFAATAMSLVLGSAAHAQSATSSVSAAAPPAGSLGAVTPGQQPRSAANPPSEPSTSGPLAVNTVTEIVVTAQKRSQKLSDVPESVSVVSGDALQKQGVRSVEDLAKIVPGLTYVDSGSSTPVFSLRGVGFFDTAIGSRPAVSVYVDETPLPFSSMAQGSAFDLQRVEVLKGPQGTLFGQNSTGGAINYIAAKPTSVFHTGYDLSYGRFNDTNFEGYVSGPVTNNVNARAALRYERSDGDQYSYTRDATLGSKDFLEGRLILDWKPRDDLKIEVNLNGFHDGGDTRAAQHLAFIAQSPANTFRISGTPNYPAFPQNDRAADWDPNTDYSKNNRFYQASIRVDWSLNDTTTVTSITSYAHYDESQLTDLDGTATPATDLIGGGHLSSFNQELRLAGQVSNLHWLTGVNYAFDRTIEHDVFTFLNSTSLYSTFPFGLAPSARANTDQRFNTSAAFVNLDYDLPQHFTVHGGARFTQADLSYSGCAADRNGEDAAGYTGLFNALRARQGLAAIPLIQPNGCILLDSTLTPALAVGRLNQNNVSWRAGLDWKPIRGLLVYANVSRGYKAGSAPTIPALSIASYQPVTQESVLAYEVGIKSPIFGHYGDISVAGFYDDYTDKQVLGRFLASPNILGPLQGLVNIPQSHVTGAEFQIDLRPVQGLTVSIGGTYLDTAVDGTFINYSILGAQESFSGDAFPYTPKYQLVAQAEYRRPITGGLEMSVGGSLNYRSSTKAGFGSETLLNIDSYTLLDLRAGIGQIGGGWTVNVYGRNVTDVYYWTNVARTADNVRRLAGQPATYGVELSQRF